MSTNSPLLTDLYQLTMGQAYWHHKRHEQEAVLHLFFRKAPFQEDAAIAARTLLDEAGFQDAHIVASNDLDASTIRRLKAEGAKIDTWGVGTKLATAYEQAALGGVYKLGAIREQEDWHYRIKLSDDPIKISNPGCLNVIRHSNHDLLYNELEELPSTQTLLETKIVDSKREMPSDSLEKIRERALVGWSEHRHHPRQLRLSPNLEITKKKLLRQHQQQ